MISALLLSVARNISSKGPRDALTGPVARRDLPTIRAHVAALREKCPRLLEPYAVISLLIAEYSAAGGDEGFMKGLREAVEGCL
jgi:predicted short-subunit dehydrogenase-like oxidoreductase (DUF2520 family)